MTDRLLTSREVAEALGDLGLTATQLKNWSLGRGLTLVPAQTGRPGPGGSGQYSISDVYRLGIALSAIRDTPGMTYVGIGLILDALKAHPKLNYWLEDRGKLICRITPDEVTFLYLESFKGPKAAPLGVKAKNLANAITWQKFQSLVESDATSAKLVCLLDLKKILDEVDRRMQRFLDSTQSSN